MHPSDQVHLHTQCRVGRTGAATAKGPEQCLVGADGSAGKLPAAGGGVCLLSISIQRWGGGGEGEICAAAFPAVGMNSTARDGQSPLESRVQQGSWQAAHS